MQSVASVILPFTVLIFANITCNETHIYTEDNKRKVREAGGIALLVSALRSPDEKIVRDAMRALRNLAFDSMIQSISSVVTDVKQMRIRMIFVLLVALNQL